MLVRCPKCESKARIAASEQQCKTVRYLYCQCLNLNCSITFKGELTFLEYIRTPQQESKPPNKNLQPELTNDCDQLGLFDSDKEIPST